MTRRGVAGRPAQQPESDAKSVAAAANSPYDESPAELLAPGDDTAAPGDPLQVARDELSSICAQINDGHRQLIGLMRRVLADELWAGAGLKSPEHWLTAFAGLSWSAAHDIVRIAGRADDLPAMTTLIDQGRLTLGQAAVVAKYTPVDHDDDVAEFASYATVTQLRRTLTRYEFNVEKTPATAQLVTTHPTAAEPGDDRSAHLPGEIVNDPAKVDEVFAAIDAATDRAPDVFDPATAPPELDMRYAAGRFHLTYNAPADIGALVEQAVLEAKDTLFRLRNPKPDAAPQPNRPRKRVTLGEAMELLAQRSLDTGAPPGSSRDRRYRIYLHLDTDGSAWLNKGAALPPVLRDRMTCDGAIQPIWEKEGRPISVGRTQRIVPDRTRRIIEDRDRGCRYPGCLALHHLECHHLDHWIDGGPTDEDRLLMLCRYHHHEHHRGAFTMVGDPSRRDGVIFTARNGTIVGPTRPMYDETRSPASGFGEYAGPTNDTLHLAMVRFDANRRAHIRPAEHSDDDPDPPAASC
ncbi:HNH endonuclease signature motif containing protein [Flexivirga meconopsidis]|uniref:HNH endonuclease signature motif containing protein n=1 Tax=Flexivirga meconopsidis TaxID=2977121 RepID=UPI002240B429|nr:HNH endonuclease signature motif containing protein [Flexivirga meconopsidis]